MQQRSEETRNHLLEAANHLFSQHGYDATGVASICQQAGVSKGAFYHHFPTKQALFLALLESWLAGLDSGFSLARHETGDVPSALLQMADLVGGVFQAADVDLTILLEFWLHAIREPAIWETSVAPYQRYQTYFATMVREGMAEGSLRPVDAELAARVLTSLAVGMLMQALFQPQKKDWQQEAHQSVQLFLSGLLAQRIEE
ncbi:MAG: TetR/AcrR family transcriptional regulator [Anaerolineales bacterium]|nr:TetR/AcrR family transcriptional regulator [Anaerolineales bacterium]